MATISNTPRPGYVWDSTDNVWYPIGVGAHQHTNAADTPAVMPYSTYAAAGKNKFINGDFGIWQRGTTGTAGYVADRFSTFSQTTTAAISQQTFTLGTAPVLGYEGTYFIRHVITSGGTAGSRSLFEQKIEDARTFAGQTVTASFWAKADAAKNISLEIAQQFGSGGSTQVNTTIAKQAITTSWTRYSFTFNVPSVAGKTIGAGSLLTFIIWTDAGSDFASRTNSLGNQSGTFDFWGMQLEAGSVATAFQTATGTLQGELAACQRYYYRQGGDSAYQALSAFSNAISTTTVEPIVIPLPVTMRVEPSALDTNAIGVSDGANAIITGTFTLSTQDSKTTGQVKFVGSGLTQYRGYVINANNSTAAYLGLSAEL